MKQTIFMICITLMGTLGLFVWGPFISIAVYYLFAVLRPQSLWDWALPEGIPWSEFVAVAATVGALMLLMSEPRDAQASRQSVSRTIGPWMIVAFGVWVFGSYLNAENAVRAYRWMTEYLKVFFMLLVALVVVRTAKQVWMLYIIATISLAYIAYEMNFLYLVNGYLAIYRRGYGGLDNNGAGLMIAMAVPLAIHAWEGTKGWWRWLYLAAVPAMLHAVLMSYSRGAMVSLLLVTPLLLARTRFRWQMGVILLLLGSLVPVLAGRQIRERFFSIQQYQQDGSANSRFASWGAAIRIANEHPFLGAGPRNSNVLSYEYGADRTGRTIHSQYLQTAADLGWVGLAFYIGILLSAWRSFSVAQRALKKRSDPDARVLRSVANGAQCSLAVFLAGAFFLSLEVFELPYFMILLAFLLRRLAQSPVAQASVSQPGFVLAPSEVAAFGPSGLPHSVARG